LLVANFARRSASAVETAPVPERNLLGVDVLATAANLAVHPDGITVLARYGHRLQTPHLVIEPGFAFRFSDWSTSSRSYDLLPSVRLGPAMGRLWPWIEAGAGLSYRTRIENLNELDSYTGFAYVAGVGVDL
jgi:hypothetical protein